MNRAEAVALAGLDRADYAEAFGVRTAVDRTPLDWARLILEGAPLAKRATMLGAWTALGIRLRRRDAVLGWRIRHNGPDAVVLGASALAGLTARLIIRTEPGLLVETMLVRFDRPFAAAVWGRVAPGHRRFIADLLARAAGSGAEELPL